MVEKISPVRKIVEELKRADLSIEDRSLLTSCILDSLVALPIRDIISTDEVGSLTVRGKVVELALAKKLRDSARVALENSALALIHEQVTFIAITTGFIKADSEKQSLFGKAAIWYGQEEVKLLTSLAQLGGVEGK